MAGAVTRWGILGAAGIARKMFLPAATVTGNAMVTAIASRSVDKALALADAFDVPMVYSSYQALFADAEVDAIYVPLPNALHVDATLDALRAGKHVLCEKPIAMNASDVMTIASVAAEMDRLAVEGFMVAYHPQWQKVRDWIASGEIGRIRRIEGCFTYYLNDANNIRNRTDGGALRDIGVYPVFVTRLITGQEPRRVLARMGYDQTAEADIETSAWLDFDGFDASFYVSSRADRTESLIVYGTHGRIEVPKAYNPPNDGTHSIHLYKGNVVAQTETFDGVFQFARQIEHVSQVFAGQASPLVTLENSMKNQQVIDSILFSEKSENWIEC